MRQRKRWPRRVGVVALFVVAGAAHLTLAPIGGAPLDAQQNAPTPAGAETPTDWEALGEEAATHLVRYLQIDTSNPPGNEIVAARFLQEILEREGIESRVLESSPGRGNVIARLRGDGSKKALVLLNHLDVVPADRRYWSVDPFGGIVKDGFVWGRGALDMKAAGVLQLMTVLALKREGAPLKRDVVFLATADEESGGGQGVGFLLREHPELLADAELVLTEGNFILTLDGRVAQYNVPASEKGPLWLRITARGPAGHGSRPLADSAVDRLLRALRKLLDYRADVKVVPEVQRFWADMAGREDPPLRQKFQDLAAALRDPSFVDEFTTDPDRNAQVRNTLAVTMLEGSSKVNVIPPEASAQVDARLLPGESPDAFLAELQRVMGDPAIDIETTLSFPGTSSPRDTELFRAIEAIAAERHPGTLVTSPMMIGFTDCRHFRAKQVPCYGFVPIQIEPRDFALVHGNDERVSLANVRSGTRMMYDIVRRVAME